MADLGGEFSFIQGNYLRVHISIRPMTSKFGRQLHLEELTQMRLNKQVLMTGYVTFKRSYKYQIWAKYLRTDTVSTHKVT